jgi:hypothetical protein
MSSITIILMLEKKLQNCKTSLDGGTSVQDYEMGMNR